MTDFPMDTVIFNKIVEVFNQTRRYVLLLFPLAFFIRIAFGFILLKMDSFTDILKDSLFLFLGLFFFTDILKMALQIPYFVSAELTFGEWRNINMGDGVFTKAIKRIVDWIGILSYWISFGLYVVIVSMLGFFAGYILFLGTMFRAYGMLKLFFILLFTVSLWPLLWYSINFAVYTIAVSDNALANNVIIGGASLAKVFIPIWLISKTSKIPIAQTLNKISFTGGSLAYAGGSYAASFLNNNTNNISQSRNVQNENNMEETHEEAEVSITDTAIPENKEEIYIHDMEDFSIREKESDRALPSEERNIPEQENSLTVNKEEREAGEVSQKNHVENNISQESSIENKQEVHIENSPQVTKEITHSQSISQNQNESVFNEPQGRSVEHEEPAVEHNQKMFNEAVHKEDFLNEEKNHIVSGKKEKNKDRDIEI